MTHHYLTNQDNQDNQDNLFSKILAQNFWLTVVGIVYSIASYFQVML